jgi:hypothetical protein
VNSSRSHPGARVGVSGLGRDLTVRADRWTVTHRLARGPRTRIITTQASNGNARLRDPFRRPPSHRYRKGEAKEGECCCHNIGSGDRHGPAERIDSGACARRRACTPSGGAGAGSDLMPSDMTALQNQLIGSRDAAGTGSEGPALGQVFSSGVSDLFPEYPRKGYILGQ